MSIFLQLLQLKPAFFHYNYHIDTSAYVEYSSSSDGDEKPQNRSKSVKRRKDDSDSGSDVCFEIILFLLNSVDKLHSNLK